MSLSQKLKKLSELFDFNKVLLANTDIKSIARYYKVNKFSYSLFHSENFIHMGITRSGVFKKEDLFEQVKIIEKFIDKRTKKTLELGTGRGANSIYLAKNHPDIEFIGIDLPKGQLQYAFKNGKDLRNFKPQEGDFHNLSNFSEKSFNIVFVVESLCHSGNKEKVIKEVKKVLKKDGLFITIDAFTIKDNLNKEELLSKRLVEKSMSVPAFENYNKFIDLLNKNMFKVVFEEDDSFEILPTLRRFEKDARILLSLPNFLSKIILKVFPSEFTYNAIAGYLMPDLIESKIASYMVVVAKLVK